MNAKVAPIVAEVTNTEAAQSGQSRTNPKGLTTSQKSRVAKFVKAHSNQHANATKNDKNIDQANKAAGLAKPQVSSEEQSQAMALRGLTRNQQSRRNVTPNVQRYHALFTRDPLFLQKDMQSLEDSLRDKGLCLVDRTTGLDESDKALRKYLLTEIILEDPEITPERKAIISQQRDYLKSQYGETIDGTLNALEQGKQLKLKGISLREFVRAYSLLELPQADNKGGEIFELFKSLKGTIEKGAGTEELVRMHNDFVEVLKREKTQHPNRITTPRQHNILSRISQLNLLIRTHSLHQQFLQICQKAKMTDLPKKADLMENCFQITVSNDMFAGVNSLIRQATAVRGLRKGAPNAFLTNYNLGVLKSDLLHGLYKNNFHRKQVVDHTDKCMRTAGILNVPKLKA